MTGTSGSPTGRVRVLIVDDEPARNEVLSAAVTEAGRRPCPALDGRSAPRTARGCAPFSLEEVVLRLRALPRRAGARHGRTDDRVHVAPILDHVWSSSFDGGGNLVEVCICDLRRKTDRGRTPMIRTVRGLGYGIGAGEQGR
ncbi:two-component system OmpR family response regulator [Streptomyces sp. SAI-135]|uniref:winged helix-turn-helix domain-containing protein n=1 Tax=unclassified Streptomyces TaxID=2593676 RepID=UPI002474401E|nr:MULTISPECIES: winged helix-turn-helix domain-containing protein [unclassified Streptomyces]MDH6515887.1 two-component system OmpR family response regulator [Streptomyces sp. SAI-090]MDH6620028.1 two-component system OmpR family response regulator [Streptomyces sp. SAI-135]